ncbi:MULTISPECIES: CPBP family intramembrane glutamic endopeptidase [unclassified Curtobacterium]|uniref:CPBP family intramembrane glutamic endopeptidase n=1 Tax=unclassified Curtobacterium TaxID=257496 RepID=UPI0009F22BD1|nr:MULTISPECIES: type II CAAX endopeptidase family protein [unclassified Curtobacterium]WIA95458.1 type II CAAX endopeptidase family protein [Curtobacterium sp. MCBA15_004]WIA98824.1 type II CAAX endopeptidase family protein [Curtobacterium sp. MCBA15_012]
MTNRTDHHTNRTGRPTTGPDDTTGRPTTGTDHTADPGLRGLVARHPLLSFAVLALGLSWLAWVPYILSPHGLGVWDLHFPEFLGTAQFTGILPGALLGPLGSAFLVTALADGRPGLRRWVGRLWRWRVSWRWYALALVVVPALVVLTGLPFAGGQVQAPSALALLALVPGLVVQVFSTGLSEEPGWRDFALPRLQERFGPLGSAAVLGPLWALWHMPLYLSDWGGWPDAHWSEPLVFALFTITFNVVMTWVFNRTGESLPIALLLHVGVNNTISTLWADMYPGMTAGTMMQGLAIVSTVAAVVLVVATRGRLGYPGPSGPRSGGADHLPGSADARLVGSNDGTR